MFEYHAFLFSREKMIRRPGTWASDYSLVVFFVENTQKQREKAIISEMSRDW